MKKFPHESDRDIEARRDRNYQYTPLRFPSPTADDYAASTELRSRYVGYPPTITIQDMAADCVALGRELCQQEIVDLKTEVLNLKVSLHKIDPVKCPL